MYSRSNLAVLLLCILLTPVLASAATVTMNFSAPLTNSQEIPEPAMGTSSQGFASASITFDDTNLAAGGLLNSFLSWSNLSSSATMGHIHRINNPGNCRSDDPTQCGTGPVLIGLFMDVRGMTDSVTVTNLAITGAQMTSLYSGLFLDPPEAGALYFNVHTLTNPAGEIRGNITEFQAVPEPGTYALLALGLGVFAVRRMSQL